MQSIPFMYADYLTILVVAQHKSDNNSSGSTAQGRRLKISAKNNGRQNSQNET
jgi:hypothetical protein